jgi:hypothetical protein
LFFSKNGCIQAGVLLEPNQCVQVVFAAETLKYIVFVLPDALNQVTGDAHLKGALRLVGQHVNEWIFH